MFSRPENSEDRQPRRPRRTAIIGIALLLLLGLSLALLLSHPGKSSLTAIVVGTTNYPDGSAGMRLQVTNHSARPHAFRISIEAPAGDQWASVKPAGGAAFPPSGFSDWLAGHRLMVVDLAAPPPNGRYMCRVERTPNTAETWLSWAWASVLRSPSPFLPNAYEVPVYPPTL
jgi:hypothetical protein